MTRWPVSGPGDWWRTSLLARSASGRCGPGVGWSWDVVGAALELAATSDGSTRAEAAWEWLVEHRPPAPARELDRPGSAVWTCTTCRARIRDTGPFASHPDDRETGHLDDCTRRLGALEAWLREMEGNIDV